MTSQTILVIEDDEDLLEIICQLLRAAGYPVVAGRDVTAVYEIEKNPPALLLIDNWLSGKTGHDICWQLKNDTRTEKIPVILISALSNLEETALRCRANDYICKPFDVEELLEKVKVFVPNE